jgi:hypothetical protein
MQDRLKEREKELGSRGVDVPNEDELVQQLEESEEEVKTLNQVSLFVMQLTLENHRYRETIAVRPQ